MSALERPTDQSTDASNMATENAAGISNARTRFPESVVIVPATGWGLADLKELWEYRELIWMLALRDIRARYKQSILGIVWVVAPPLVTMVIFSVVFGILMGADGRPSVAGVPYAVSTFCALVIWQLFASSLRNAGNSLIQNRNLILKVYFPRLVVLVAPTIAGIVDFFVSFIVLLVLIAGYEWFGPFGFTPGLTLVFLPFFVLLAAITAFSLSIWIAGLGAVYRDFNLFGPVSIQLLMYATPVLYTYQSIASALGEWGSLLYALNPMVGVVEGFRWAVLGSASLPWELLACSCAVDSILLTGGLFMFRHIEPLIVDVI